MPNSTISLNSIAGYIRTYPDLSSVIQSTAGGASLRPMLDIANDVMTNIISQKFNWKWNRFILPNIYTNSFQQDYATTMINLGWLEHGFCLDVNNTAMPLPKWPLECVKDLEESSQQYGRPGQACWLPNDQLEYATWGAANPGGSVQGPNPQPNQTITNPVAPGTTAGPNNPFLQVRDPNGNLWIVTTFGTTGSTQPSWVNPPVYPTQSNPTTVASTTTDGTVVWTAVNPKGMGMRVNPIPPLTGVVYQLILIGQWRPFAFTNGPYSDLDQTIEPIPDDFAQWFKDGCVAFAYEHASKDSVRAKAIDAKAKWLTSLAQSMRQGDHERDNAGFYPATDILQQPFSIYPGPAYPYNLPWG